MRHIKTAIIALALLMSANFSILGVAQAAPLSVVALQGQSDACAGLDQLGGTSCGNNAGQSAIGNVIQNVVSIISYIAGAVAIIMIIISGIRFTTSGGDSNSVSSAKTTLVYALIGVVIAALAQVLVHFVLNKTNV